MSFQASVVAGAFRRLRTTLMMSAACLALTAGTGQALAQTGGGSDTRVEALEQQLRDLLGVVNRLSDEIASLRATRSGGATAANSLDEVEIAARFQRVEDKMADAGERLDDVEDLAFDLDEKIGSRALIRAFDAKSFDLGGFFHTAATLVDGRDNTEVGVNRLTFELLAKAELSDKWSLFVA